MGKNQQSELSNGKSDFELWKHFQEDANKIKDRMWTITTWLFTLKTGVIGFIFKFFTDAAKDDVIQYYYGMFSKPLIVLLLAIVGIFICIYTFFMVRSYGTHISTCWKRSNFILKRNYDLLLIWKSGFKNPNDDLRDPPAIPKEAKRIFWLVSAFGLIFLLISILSISQIMMKMFISLVACTFHNL